MEEYVTRLRAIVRRTQPALQRLSEEEAARAPAPGKWSPKELLGHLIDSASVNHERFVRAQQVEDLVFPGYDQDAWVATNAYQGADWSELVALWSAFNLHVAHVMASASAAQRTRPRHPHNLHVIGWQPVPPSEPATLEQLMSDYVGHLEHHLGQLLKP